MLSGTLRKTQLDSQAQIVDLAGQGRSRPPAPQTQVLRHRMDEFVVGESNRLAYTAAMAVGGGQGVPFNPLFIHGSCGVGKTHLLQGVCELAGRRRTGGPMTWRYVTGEQFTNEFITALRHKKIDEFRARYRKLDLLAIDDVHFLAAKKATQDEFLHTFNTIASAGKQIVMASDAHPRMVGELNEQLVSRFLAGMVVKVNAPDPATRLEILQRRATLMKLGAASEVLEYIAMHVRGSVRELEGALFKLSAIAALEGGTVTLAMASEAMSDHLARTDSVVTLGDIEATVSAFFGITPADIHSSRRTRTVSVARMVSMFLARRHTRMSYPEIGRFMGKNHSSAVLAVQRMEQLLTRNEPLEWLTPMGPKALDAAKVVQMLTEQFA
jgi:chromosomal replication initiator protein